MKTRILLSGLVFAVTVLWGCGGESTLSPAEELAERITAGWGYYDARDYANAETEFRVATQISSASAEAQVGLGWSRLWRDDLSDARYALLKPSSSSGAWYRDAQAGLAVIYDAQGLFDKAISSAQVVLDGDSEYVHSHDSRVDWRDLRYILAKNYLIYSDKADPEYTRTTESLHLIDTVVPALDPGDQTTWTAGGVQYATFREAAAKRLEALQPTLDD